MSILGPKTIRERNGEINVRLTKTVVAPVATAATLIVDASFQANWNVVSGATHYYLQVATSSNFSSGILAGFNNLFVNAASKVVTSLSPRTTYYYRVAAAGFGGVSAYSNVITLISDFAEAVLDTYTDVTSTLLTSHVGEKGAIWTVHPSRSGDVRVTDANRIRSDSSAFNVLLASGVLASANYRVRTVMRRVSADNQHFGGVVGRASATVNTMYMAQHFWDNFNAGWRLLRYVNGVETVLGFVSEGMVTGNDYTLDLLMNGTTISLLVNGISRISVTDANIVGVGRVGVMLVSPVAAATNTKGIHIDSILAETI